MSNIARSEAELFSELGALQAGGQYEQQSSEKKGWVAAFDLRAIGISLSVAIKRFGG